jgi:hypothetical protein
MDLHHDLLCNLYYFRCVTGLCQFMLGNMGIQKRFQCGIGPFQYMLQKWGYSDSQKCDCGVKQTMQQILQ